MGYEQIPDYWKQGLDRVEDRDFKYTTISLNDTYEMGFGHALQMIERNGGSVDGEEVIIHVTAPEPVKYEVAFEGHYPVENQTIRWGENQLTQGGNTEYAIEFENVADVQIRNNRITSPDDKSLKELVKAKNVSGLGME